MEGAYKMVGRTPCPQIRCAGGCGRSTDPTTAWEEWYDERRPEGRRVVCPDCADSEEDDDE